MKNIAIIGAGNIGTRHLQGMYGLNEKYNIYVYDLSEQSLEMCQKTCADSDVMDKQEVMFVNDLSNLPKNLDLVVVATNANVRRKVVEEMVAKFSIKYFILEKVLFQKIEDYNFVKELFEKNGIEAWVNCPKRIYPDFIELKNKLKNADSFEVDVYGNNWGMGCNTIHYVDLISFLADDEELSITASSFDEEIIESKRKGFYELNGSLQGTVGRCTNFRITSYPNAEESIPLTMSIHSKDANFIIIEGKREMLEYSKANGWNMEKKPFEILYQSQLAYIPINDIMEKGQCNLATYDRAMKEHLPVIECFIDNYFKKKGIGEDTCPIT